MAPWRWPCWRLRGAAFLGSLLLPLLAQPAPPAAAAAGDPVLSGLSYGGTILGQLHEDYEGAHSAEGVPAEVHFAAKAADATSRGLAEEKDGNALEDGSMLWGPEPEGEEERREEEVFRPVDIGIAWMLLGTVAAVMLLFYMVNWPDDDIRRYSWQIISSTISIFTAVLIFQAIEQFTMTFVPESAKHTALVVAHLLFLAFFIMLQLCIAITSGANCEAEPVDLDKEVWCYADFLTSNCGYEAPEEQVKHWLGNKGVAVLDGIEVFVEKTQLEREWRERRMKANATLLAHMTGFAVTNMGGHLMHLDLFAGSWIGGMVVVVLIQVFLYILFRIAKEVRHFTTGLDGTRDERDKLYDEEVSQAENDIHSLAVSFLTVQVLRFVISGEQPGINREAEVEVEQSVMCILILYCFGVLFAAIAVYGVELAYMLLGKRTDLLERPLELFQTTCGMVFAWSTLWATEWLVTSFNMVSFVGGPHSMAGRIVIAAGLSLLSVLLIGFLDRIEDRAKAAGESEAQEMKVVRCIITSLGIMVGFSWEHCFNGGVAVLASLTSTPGVTKLWLAGCLALGIFPAWRRYILAKVIAYRKVRHEALVAFSRSKARGPRGYHRVSATTYPGEVLE